MAENISKETFDVMETRMFSSMYYLKRLQARQILMADEMVRDGYPLEYVLDALGISRATWFRRLAEAKKLESSVTEFMDLYSKELPRWTQLNYVSDMVRIRVSRAAGGGASGSGAA